VQFATKQLVGVLVHLIGEAGKRLANDPVKNAHAKKIREDPFYKDILLQKNEHWCELYGWKMPMPGSLKSVMAAPVVAPTPENTPIMTATPVSANAETPLMGQTTSSSTGKKKKRRFSLFSNKKSPALDPTPPPTTTAAAIMAMFSPKKSVRPLKTPGTNR